METIVALVVLAIGVLSEMAAYCWLIVVYVMEGKGLYAIARRRGFSAPWMAWVPFANAWLFGSVSDHYQKTVHGRTSRRGKTLLALKIALQAVNTLSGVLTGVVVGTVLAMQLVGAGSGWERTGMIMLIAFAFGLLPVLAISTVYFVFSRFVCYDLYASSMPDKAVGFLLLSIFTPATPFMIYACRNSDDGLPPKPQE